MMFPFGGLFVDFGISFPVIPIWGHTVENENHSRIAENHTDLSRRGLEFLVGACSG